jgi:hypothetical protein
MTPFKQSLSDFLTGQLNRGSRFVILMGAPDQGLEDDVRALVEENNWDVWLDAGALNRGLEQRMMLARLDAEATGQHHPRARLTVLTGHAGEVSDRGKDFMVRHAAMPVGYFFRPASDQLFERIRAARSESRVVDPLAPENFQLTPPRGARP